MTDQAETAEQFLTERGAWMDTFVTPTSNGGWAVAVVLDGTYTDRTVAETIREYFEQRLAALLPPTRQPTGQSGLR